MNSLLIRSKRMIDILRTNMSIVCIVLIVSAIEGLVLAIYHQWTGSILTTHSLNLFWLGEIRLPFSVSRLWDIFLVPLCTLGMFAFVVDITEEDTDGSEPATGYLFVFLTWIITTVFGITYLPIAAIASITSIIVMYGVIILYLVMMREKDIQI